MKQAYPLFLRGKVRRGLMYLCSSVFALSALFAFYSFHFPDDPPTLVVTSVSGSESSAGTNNDMLLCDGAPFTLTASGASAAANLTWRLNSTGGPIIASNATIVNASAGSTNFPIGTTRTVFVVDDNGTGDTGDDTNASIVVTVLDNPITIDQSANRTYCVNDASVDLRTLAPFNTTNNLSFSGAGIEGDGFTFDPSDAAIGSNAITVNFLCPDPSGSTALFYITVIEDPVSTLEDQSAECRVFGVNSYLLTTMFTDATTSGGTFEVLSGPGSLNADGVNLDYTSAGCFSIRYTAPNNDGCQSNPASSTANLFISEAPDPSFEITNIDAIGGCTTTSTSVNVNITSPTYSETPTYQWNVTGASISGANTASPTITIAAPAAGNSIYVEISLTETFTLAGACGGITPETVCSTTTSVQSITVFNDGLDCNSVCEALEAPDPCELETNPRFTIGCNILSIDLFDVMDADITQNGDQLLGCETEEICIDYNGNFSGFLGAAIEDSPSLGDLPGADVVCDILTFSIDIPNPLPIGPDPLVSIKPFGFLPDFILDACDKTIGEFIIDAIGEAIGGDGGGGELWADTDGDGYFDTLLDDGDLVFSGNACVPNNVQGQGTITVRLTASWPNSPGANCGEELQPEVPLLDLLPIGAIPLVGPQIEDVLAAGGCNIDIAFSDEETVQWEVRNDQAPVFANCPSATGYTFSDVGNCLPNANWSIPVAYDGCDETGLPFISDPMSTDFGVRHISGPMPGDALDIGIYDVLYRAEGCNGMTTDCAFTVTVTAGDPLLVCPNDVTISTDVDMCSAEVLGLSPLSGVACNVDLTYSTTGATVLTSAASGINDISGATFNLGTTTVTYTLSYDDDGDPNTDPAVQTCEFDVTIVDRQLPTIACLDIAVQLDNTGSATVTALQIDGGTIDNCNVADLEISGNGQDFGASIDYDCSNIGNNTATLQATDDAGNERRCLATVTIIDFFEDFELELDVPELCLEANNPEQLTFANYLVITQPNGTDIDHDQVGTIGPGVVGAFGITAFVPGVGSGMTMGTSADDPGDIGYVDPATGLYTPGNGYGYVTISYVLAIGEQIAQNGAQIEGCYAIVHDIFELRQPLDLGSPECVCGDFEERIVDMGTVTGGLEPYTIQYAGATLDIDGDGVADDFDGEYVYMPGNGHDITDFQEDLGELRVEYTQPTWEFTIVDARGCELFRSGSCDNDDQTEGPEITCPVSPAPLGTEELVCEAHYEWQHPLPTDNCAVFLYNYQILNPDGSIDGPHNLDALLNIAPGAPIPALFEAEYEFELGTSVITYYAEDAVGNFITCEFEVTVIDDDPPYFINCPYPPVVENAETDHCDAYVNFALPLAEDNCDVPVVTQIDDTGLETGDRFPVGTTILYYEAVDLAGNADTCQVKVVVNDYWVVPTIVCPNDVVQATDEWRCDAEVFDIAPVVSSPCEDNLAITYEIFRDEALTDRVECGVWDASGEMFEKGDSWVKYTVQNQPLLLITEVSQSSAVDQMEITNLGPGALDISCLVAARTAANPAADETLADVTMLPSLAPTVVGVGETFVFDFTFDGGAAMGACYTISYAGTILDQVAVNGFAGCDVFTGTLNSGDVYRTCEADTNDAADWEEAELCFPLTIGMLNPDLEAMPDNGTQMGLQSIAPNMAMCVFKVTINDEEDPFCGELNPNTNTYTGGAIADVNAASCNRSTLTIPDDCIIGTLTLNVNGTVTPANSTITLISPAGTEVQITSLPAMPDDFYTEKSGGDWILDIEPIGGPFSVTDWSIDIVCMDEFMMPDVVLPNDPGECGADFTWTHPFFVDNCFEGTISVDYSTMDADCTPPDGQLIGVGGYEVTEFFCVGTTTVTYTLIDESGNDHMCSFDVTVNDVEDPVVVCPDDITISLNSGECRRKVCFDPVLATDNCEVVDTVSVPESCSDFEIGTTEVTITVFDEAGNSAECMFNINIIEYVPDSYDLFCNDLINISLGPDCTEEVMADMILEGNDYHCYEDYEITITNSTGNVIATNPVLNESHFGQTFVVTVFDPDSGNTCWGEIFVEDHQSPIIECPADITIKCNDPQDPLYTGEPELLSCEASTTHFFNDVFDDFGACADIRGEITRTWTVTDEAENSTSCTQVITIERITLDDVIFPVNLDGFAAPVLNCEAVAADPTLLDPSNTGAPTANGQLIGGAVLCGLSVKMTENPYPICEGSYDILRTWSVYDPCHPAVPGVNPITFIQVIKVVDLAGPQITCGPDVTVSTNGGDECTASVIIPPADINDACSSWDVTTDTPTGTINGNGGLISGLEIGIYTITYNAIDACGNPSACSYELTVADLTPPVPICDEITDVDLTSDGTAVVPADVFDDGSYDDCCLDEFLVRRMDGDCDGNFDDFGPDVTFCCDDALGDPIMVVFRAVDCEGNTNECMVSVEVGDKLPPVVVCPEDETITCDEYLEELDAAIQAGDYTLLDQFGDPTFWDNCEPIDTYTVGVNIDACASGTITRTWEVTDPAGNFPASCTQTITVEHVSDWVVEFPEDIDAVCTDGELPEFGEPAIFHDECELIGTAYEDEYFYIVPDACYKIIRTWTAINWCIYDELGYDLYPEEGFSEADLFQDWDGDGDRDERTFRDGWNSSGTPGTPDGYIWWEQVIKVVDNDEPTFTIPEIDGCIVEIDCDKDLVIPYPDITDVCSPDFEVDITGSFGVFNDVQGDITIDDVVPGTYDIYYTVTDNCGNQAYDDVTVVVEDCKKPTPYCKNGIVVELMQTCMVDVWAVDLNDASFDNCPGDLQYSFSSDVNDIGWTFTCDQVGINEVQIWVTDAAGNQDFCVTNIIIQDNMFCGCTSLTVSGAIETEDEEGVQDVTVDVNGGLFSQVTPASGEYHFFDLQDGDDYSFVPSNDLDAGNGVTTYDLVLITLHILGVQPLDSPYKMIAADANNSTSITTLDLVYIRRIILQIDNEFPNNTSWRFVDGAYDFPDASNPWYEPFPEVVSFNNLNTSQLDVDFVGVKVGDVNGSAQANNLMQAQDRNFPSSFQLKAQDQRLESGETFTVEFTATEAQLLGYQFTMNFDQDALELIDIVEGTAKLENFGTALVAEGALTTSWNMAEAQNLKGERLFSLTFRANASAQLSDLLSISSRYTLAEAYDAKSNLMNVDLAWDNAASGNVFALYQNVPNPFANTTMIGFELPENQTATLTIMDVKGQVLKVIEGEFNKGYNEVSLDKVGLKATGVLQYRLETSSDSATRTMILIE